MIEFITQSFQKDYKEYLAGNECGKIIEEKYLHDRFIDDPDAEPGAKELGAYFEFISFGTLPKNKVIPKPEMMADGKKMMAPYRLATINSERLLAYLDVMGLEVIKAGWTVTKGRHRGTIDIMVRCKKEIHFANGIVWHVGDVLVIDIKYSGLIGDTIPSYNKHGWKWSEVQTEYHGTQAIKYHYLTGAPFYFMVCQSNNKEGTLSDFKFFHVQVSEPAIENHLAEGNRYYDHFVIESKIGLDARPSLKRCQKCPLKATCEYKILYPVPELIVL